MDKNHTIKLLILISLIILVILIALTLSSLYTLKIENKTSIQEPNITNSTNLTQNLQTPQIQDTFTLIVLPDTQYYSKNYPEIFTSQTQWIVENQKKLNIRMVIHEGDLVDNDVKTQWDNANNSLSILEKANIPFSVVPGNHDTKEGLSYSSYNLYFPAQRFENNSWYGGSFDNYRNNYQLLKINNKNYIFLNLDLCPSKKDINWANQVLNNYSTSTAILTTHAYLDSSNPPNRGVKLCGSTQYIWDELIKQHENLQLVFSGHISAERIRTDQNLAGKPVYQILADYQSMDKGGLGYLRIIKLNQDSNTISVETYSPYLNLYKIGNESEFSLKL